MYLKKGSERLLWMAEGEVRGVFMLLGEAQTAKFRSEVLQPIFRGVKQAQKDTLGGR